MSNLNYYRPYTSSELAELAAFNALFDAELREIERQEARRRGEAVPDEADEVDEEEGE